MDTEFVEIDGSFGEGGGSILRLSCALSVLTSRPVKIFSIRKGRPKQGLRAQHLAGLQALADISNGTLENGKIGATEIFFRPGKVSGGHYKIDISTAGSIGLILQILQLACIHATGRIDLEIDGGATFGLWAPTLPYIEHVLIPHLQNMGYKIDVDILRHGFYPKGGAKVSFQINPVAKLNPIKLEEFGEITEIGGISIATFHLKNRDVAKRQLKAAKNVIRKNLGINPWIDKQYVEAMNPGSGICLWLKTDSGVILGSDIIGEKRKPSEKIGTECARYLCDIAKIKATADRFLSDQIIPFMALAHGISIIKPSELTNHTKTNVWLIEKFLGKKFTINSINPRYEIKISNDLSI